MNLAKKIFIVLAASYLALAPVAAKPAQLEEQEKEKPKVNLSLRTDWLSRYMFRGFALSEGPVLQPSIAVNYRDFTLIGFANFDDLTGKFNEADFTVDFTRPIGKATFSVGYTNINFPNTETPKTQEFYAAAGIETLLKPSIIVVHDFNEGNGDYAEIGIGHNLKIEKTTISLKGRLGYNNHYYREESGFSHFEAGISMPVPAGKFTITPSIIRTESLDNHFQSQTWGIISVKYDF